MIPKDKKLYNNIKKEIYELNPKHSLFRSASIVRKYKQLGGEFVNPKIEGSIPKWFEAEWISVNDYHYSGKIVPCGSSDTQEKFNEYPLCRPLEIVKKLSANQMKKMIDEKNKLGSKHLITSKILKTDKFNVK
jgi:hypothetical protein